MVVVVAVVSVAMAASVSVVAAKAVQAAVALDKPRKMLWALQTLVVRMDLMW